MAFSVADLLPSPVKVPISGTDKFIEVRALNLREIVTLLSKHQQALLEFFSPSSDNLDALILSAPDMVADIIAFSCDAVGQEEDIKKLPFGVQAEAIIAIWQLSVPDLKKLTESLSKVVATQQKLSNDNL